MGEEVALITGFPSETLCTARASMDGASSEGKLVLWVGMTVHHEKKEREESQWWMKVVCVVNV